MAIRIWRVKVRIRIMPTLSIFHKSTSSSISYYLPQEKLRNFDCYKKEILCWLENELRNRSSSSKNGGNTLWMCT